MKISKNTYKCLCGNIIEQEVRRSGGNFLKDGGRKHVGVDMVKCSCGMLVSQKDAFEIRMKLEAGEKI